ncbi:hypothetical protein M5X16_15285, partial [Paenibacillus chitinolyticus]
LSDKVVLTLRPAVYLKLIKLNHSLLTRISSHYLSRFLETLQSLVVQFSKDNLGLSASLSAPCFSGDLNKIPRHKYEVNNF